MLYNFNLKLSYKQPLGISLSDFVNIINFKFHFSFYLSKYRNYSLDDQINQRIITLKNTIVFKSLFTSKKAYFYTNSDVLILSKTTFKSAIKS